MATLLLRALRQKLQFFVKKLSFSSSKRLYLIFLARLRTQRLRIYPCAKFQFHWTKDKGTQILTWNDTKNGLIASSLLPGDDVSKWLSRDFVPEYHHA